MSKTCGNCNYWSGPYECVCVNSDSEKCADFVMADNGCPEWKEKEHEQVQFPD